MQSPKIWVASKIRTSHLFQGEYFPASKNNRFFGACHLHPSPRTWIEDMWERTPPLMEIAPRYSSPKIRPNTCQEGVSSNQEVYETFASLEKHAHLQYQCRFTYLLHVPFWPHKSLGCLPNLPKNPSFWRDLPMDNWCLLHPWLLSVFNAWRKIQKKNTPSLLKPVTADYRNHLMQESCFNKTHHFWSTHKNLSNPAVLSRHWPLTR